MPDQPRLSPLALLALGQLAEAPMHPYEMYSLAIQRRDQRLVKIRPGTLYHAVSRLEKDGLIAIRGVERDGNRPERTTYEITPAGRAALRRDLARLLAEPVEEYPIFPFVLGEAHNLPRDQVVELLQKRLSVLRGTMADIETGLASVRTKNLPWAYWLQLEYLHAQHQTQLAWLEGALTDIAAGRFDLSTTDESRTTEESKA